MQKVHFRLTSVAQKRCCLSSLIWSSENEMDARERRDSKPPLRAFLLLLVFLKVLRLSFPVPVVSSRSLVRFWRRKHKKSTTRASRPWQNLSARLVGKSILFLACVASVLKERRFRAREKRERRGMGRGGNAFLLPPPSHAVSRPNSLSRTFRTPATQSILFPSPQTHATQANLRTTKNPSVSKLRSQFKMELRWSYMWRLNNRRIQDGLVTG